MSSLLSLVTLLAVLLTHCIFAQDEDFAFEVSEDFELEFDSSNSRKIWGDKEITANVGKVFHLAIPREAFNGNIQAYEAKVLGGKSLPLWLLFDKTGGVFWGVPQIEDIRRLHIIIKSLGSDKNLSEEFILNVVEPTKEYETKSIEKCPTTEDDTILTLLLDKGVSAIKPKQRVVAINNIAKFFGLPYSAFTLKPQLGKDDITDSSVILAGPGNLQSRSSKFTTLLQVPVGCDGRLWVRTAPIVHQLKQQARDGTISEVVGLPLVGWRVKTETRPILRSKRQLDDYGSGDYDDDYDNYEDEYDEGEDLPQKVTTPQVLVTPSIATSTVVSESHPHRHHHGEPKSVDDEVETEIVPRKYNQDLSSKVTELDETTIKVLPTVPTTISTTPSTTTSTTTRLSTTTRSTTEFKSTTQKLEDTNPPYEEYDYEDYEDEDDEGGDEDQIESKTIVPDRTIIEDTVPEVSTKYTTSAAKTTTPKKVELESTMPLEVTTPIIVEDTEPATISVETSVVPTLPTTTTTAATTTTTTPVAITTTQSSTSSSTTSPATTTLTTTSSVPNTTSSLAFIPTSTEEITTEEEFSTKLTTVRYISSTPRATTIREVTEEGLEYGTKNFQPYIENRIQQMSVTAGKIFRFVIPKNTFKDFEDGYNLTIDFLNAKGEPLNGSSWCHYKPTRREIYGLPLEEDVSKWEYILKATDREGAFVTDHFTIQVQQHKAQRVVNHEFSIHIRIEKRHDFLYPVDWCLKVLRALGTIYNTNMSEITVRNVNYTNEPVVFTWTNDSIRTDYCPKTEIEDLFNVLVLNDRGDPSIKLNRALEPELRAKKVVYQGLGVCEPPQTPVTPPTNFPPFLRNPVDHINATVGELLIFKVPDDTFYDPEDVDSRNLNISLLTADRQPIPPNNWLQFDSKNREFFGIPKEAGRSEYQLVCLDSAGLPATDSLELVVYPEPKITYNVRFTMAIETRYNEFINSASTQRKFVEKLKEIFGDRDTSYIHLNINPLKGRYDTTIVTWFNKSLSTLKCPSEEITQLESILTNRDRGISSRVHSKMGTDFPISTIKVILIGNCKTTAPTPEDRGFPIDEPAPESNSDEYLIAFIIPAVIISIMLFLAAVAACVLYRRRRTGKMNVEEDGRQSYGNKGIPVIFQEELEEKPEVGTKTPVILKDEKPPLAPPEYSKSGSLKLTDDSEPYQPPPPFTRTQDNGRQSRPKPTPTYRKPPPYVPP